MTIVEFLEARLAEDERTHQPVESPFAGEPPSCRYCSHPFSDGAEVANVDLMPCRVLREVEAKRAIIAEHWDAGPGPDQDGWSRGVGWCGRCDSGNQGGVDWPCPTIRALASVYADHPDFDEAWRAVTV